MSIMGTTVLVDIEPSSGFSNRGNRHGQCERRVPVPDKNSCKLLDVFSLALKKPASSLGISYSLNVPSYLPVGDGFIPQSAFVLSGASIVVNKLVPKDFTGNTPFGHKPCGAFFQILG